VVIQQTNVKERLKDTIRKRKLKFCLHVMRHNTLQRVILEGQVEGRRGRGKPRPTWWRNIEEWTGGTYEENKRITQNRELRMAICVSQPPSRRQHNMIMRSNYQTSFKHVFYKCKPNHQSSFKHVV
jgi:hypothetical protein